MKMSNIRIFPKNWLQQERTLKNRKNDGSSKIIRGEYESYRAFQVVQWCGKESACSTGNVGSIYGLETSPGGRNGYTLHYSCLENPLDRGAWQATVHEVTESDITEHPHTMKVIGDPHTTFEEGHILQGLK